MTHRIRMYGIYANIGGILMVNVTIYSIQTDPMGIMELSRPRAAKKNQRLLHEFHQLIQLRGRGGIMC